MALRSQNGSAISASTSVTTVVSSSITGISQAASAVVTVSDTTATNPYQPGSILTISGVAGMTQINGLTGTVTAIGGASGAWTLTLNIDSSAFSAYTSGGTIGLGIQVDDVIVIASCFVTGGQEGTVDDPSGFTPGSALTPAIQDVNIDVGGSYLHLSAKVATSTEVAATSFTTASGSAYSSHWSQQIFVLSGRDSSSLSAALANQVATASTAEVNTPTTFDLTGLTANAGDDLLAIIGTATPYGRGTATFSAAITGFSDPLDTIGTNTYDPGMMSLIEQDAGAGATGTLAAAISATSVTTLALGGFLLAVSAPQVAAALEGAASDATAASGTLNSDFIAAAVASTIATGNLYAFMSATPTASTELIGSLATAILAAAAATDATSAGGTLTNWASVVLAAPLYTGEGSILDASAAWSNGAPGAGDTVFYDGTYLTIETDGEIVATSNSFSALCQWDNGGTWSYLSVIVTAGFASGATVTTEAVASLATGVQLVAAAQAMTAAAAQLNTQIELDGAISSVTTAAAALTAAVKFAATAIDDSSGSGTLVGTANKLAGSASDNSNASAVLNTQITMLGAAVDLTTALGDLATQIRLGANAVSISGAQGSLETGIRVSGSGSASITGAGVLSTSIKLAGAANSASAAAATLLTAIQAVAGAVDDSNAVGQLKTSIILSQAVTAVSSAVGALSTLITMVGAAQDGSSASGSLTTKPGVLLAGDATDDTQAAGDLGTRGDMQPAPATDDSTASGALRTGIDASGAATDDTTATAGLTTFLDPDANATDDSTAAGVLSGAGSTIFTADVLVQVTPQALDTEFGLLPFGRFYQRVGDKLCYAIDWTGWLAAFWKPSVQVVVGDVVRPWTPNGFQYRCVYPGVTGGTPPAFAPYLNSIVQDGAAQWRCMPLDDTSLSAELEAVEWTAPTGIVVTKNQVVGLVSSAVIDTSAATPYTDYDVLATASASDGRQRVGRLVILAR